MTEYMLLRIMVEDPELKEKYVEHIARHNHKMTTEQFADSGFDLITPYFNSSIVGSHRFVSRRVNKLDLKVKCAAILCHPNGTERNTGYYLYPRSSISKTCIRLANSVGIIDAGYRGSIMTMLDVIYGDEFYLEAYQRMFQICAPGLLPILVELVDDLGVATSRGEGGFGSTDCV